MPKKYQKQEHQVFKNSENVLLIGCRLANSTSNLNKITSDSSLVQNHVVLKSQANSPTTTSATTSTATTSTKVTTSLSSPPANGKDDAQMVSSVSQVWWPCLPGRTSLHGYGGRPVPASLGCCGRFSSGGSRACRKAC